MNKTIKIFLALSISLLSFYGCSDDDDSQGGGTTRDHVLIVYLGGDNNLAGETNEKLGQMQDGWDGRAVGRILVYQDARGAKPRLIELQGRNSKGESMMKVVAEYEEENSANSTVFGRVIADVKTAYPSSSYGLLLFSHASGWLPERTLSTPRGATIAPRSIVQDGSDEMEIIDLARAIPDNTFEYIAFEACFMTGIEVVYELKDKTQYILGSSAEIVSPGFTTHYNNGILQFFNGIEGVELFAKTVFHARANAQGAAYERSATYSIIKTSELEPLAAFVKQNADYTKAINVTDVQHFDRYTYRLFFDFEDYYSRLLNTDAQKQQLRTLVENCIVWKNATPYFFEGLTGQRPFKIDKHSGMTTYIIQEQYPYLKQKYTDLKWYSVAY